MDRPRDPSLLYALVFLGLALLGTLLLGAHLPGEPPVAWTAAWLLAISAATVGAYGYDKAIAGRQVARVPERILLLLALLGGSPAAMLAMRLFRHKTVKPGFQRAFGVVLVVQVAVISALVAWWMGAFD
ncbi:MAG: DUF1294 domain-containing protein [Planctomycetes bacterium]|nr:DUF1294 domain-containing protein [Planctomycetota bacterium]